jgi:hypothetical protein
MRKYVLLLAAFLSFQFLVAQEKKEVVYKNTPLQEVLNDIENKFSIRFSFSQEAIKDVIITLEKELLDLEVLLVLLTEQTSLNFEKVSQNQVIIIPKDASDTDVEALKQIILKAYVTSGIDKNKDGSITIDTEELGILPGLIQPDIAQSVQLIPGITSLDESAVGIQIRGGAPDQNLVLLDGIKLYNTGYFYGMFSAFNPYATKRAKVYKSAPSPVYGDRISGVIDITTGTEIPEKTEGGFGIDGLSVDAFVKTKLSDKSALYVFTRRSYSDLLKTFTYNGYATKIFRNTGITTDVNGNVLGIETDDSFDISNSSNEFRFFDFNAKWIYKPNEKEKLEISGLATSSNLDFSFGTEELISDDILTRNNGISVNWVKENSEKWTQTIKGYFINYDSDYQNLEIKEGILEEIVARKNFVNDFGFDLFWNNRLKEKSRLLLGYQFSNTNLSFEISETKPLEPEENTREVQKQVNSAHSFFAEYQYDLKDTGLLSFGLRSNLYSSVAGFYVEPRFNLEYPISSKLRLKSSAEQRYQPISQIVEFDETELRLENNIWRLTDDTTFPLLKSTQYSAGFLFDANGWTIDVDSYLKNIRGLTSYTNGFSNPVASLSEGESRIFGVDVLVKKKINNYRIWLGYTFNDVDYTFPQIEANSFPGNNDITHNFRISNALLLKNTQVSLGWIYRTGEPITPITTYDSDTEIVTFGGVNSGRLVDYHRLDASILHNFDISYGDKKVKAQIGVSALNLYNRKIPLSYTNRIDNDDDTGEQTLEQVIQRFSIGFTTNFSFRIFF